MRLLLRSLVVLVALSLNSCVLGLGSIRAEGRFTDNTDFGASFFPNGTGFAVYDRFVTRDDGTVDQRPEGQVRLFLSGASFDPTTDLQALGAAELEDLIQQVRTRDLLIISELTATAVAASGVLEATQPPAEGPFNFLARRAAGFLAPNSEPTPPMGSRLTLRLTFTAVDLRDYGRVVVEPALLKAEQGEDQTARASTGEITLHINIPVIPERLAESNLELLSRAWR
ncbi:MAG: hypothetical protein AB2A00_10475 [Myxococcota bacterium]